MEDDGCFTIEPTEEHVGTVIFLHGLGDSGFGVRSWMKSVGFQPLGRVKYMFPTAPFVPVTSSGGMAMNSWFDCITFRPKAVQKEDEVARAASSLDDLITAEINRGIPAERILVGGLSQGGAVVLYWSVTRSTHVAGIVALSTWLPSDAFPEKFSGNPDNKLFIGHGKDDTLIDLSWAKPGHDIVRKLLPSNTYRVYDGLPHSLGVAEIADVMEFFSESLPKANEPEPATSELNLL